MTTQAVRYSTANVGKSSQAQSFPWEGPIPVTPFWDSLTYSAARNFLTCFTSSELDHLPIDPTSTANNDKKLELLLQILTNKLTTKQSASTPNSLHETDYNTWNTLHLAIFSIQSDLNLLPEAEQTARIMADNRPDKSNLSPLHALADILLRRGKYPEAENQEREVCAWMDSHPRLGRDSPQALSARRIIAEAMWKQGVERRGEAERMVGEIWEMIGGMGEGKFAVYKEEEGMLTGEFLGRLDRGE